MNGEDDNRRWKVVDRVGYLGKLRDYQYELWNQQYGQGLWRFMWGYNGGYTDYFGACLLYKQAYRIYLEQNLRIEDAIPEEFRSKYMHRVRPGSRILDTLISDASNVYDDAPSNVLAGQNFMHQETLRTHIQDSAIRDALRDMGIWFEGEELLQIRHDRGMHPLSIVLSPGVVPFHQPDLIVWPSLSGWWKPKTVEDFYQSNRYLWAYC